MGDWNNTSFTMVFTSMIVVALVVLLVDAGSICPFSGKSMARLVTKATPCSKALDKLGRINLEETKEIIKRNTRGATSRSDVLELIAAENAARLGRAGVARSDTCARRPPSCPAAHPSAKSECVYSKYRDITGYCNNIDHRQWGRSHSAFRRLLPPNYGDHISALRVSHTGQPLPNPRNITVTVHDTLDAPGNFAYMLMQWLQFLDHDITLTPEEHVEGGCCQQASSNTSEVGDELPEQCIPIHIASDDEVHRDTGITCIDVVRSVGVTLPDGDVDDTTEYCSLGVREQLNQLTAFIDASNVYGSTSEELARLRDPHDRTLLLTQKNPLGSTRLPFLPNDYSSMDCDITGSTNKTHCLLAGDSRVSEQPGLASLHTLFMREHNRLAMTFKKSFGTYFTDEVIFQEVRRIVGAEMQHITYTEALPIVLGRGVMETHHLSPTPQGHHFGYDSSVNPGIYNVFAAAAFRFGHSLIGDMFTRPSSSLHQQPLNISTSFFKPEVLSGVGIDPYLRGLAHSPARHMDSLVSSTIRDRLFPRPGSVFGEDLIARNIQRARDHGVQAYNQWRRLCGLTPPTDYQRLGLLLHRPPLAEAFEAVYGPGNVDDIDLFSAGISEKPVEGGLVGETFACILARQFSDLKHGDRFWYENGDQPSSFTLGQLSEIRKVSLARVICDNTDTITRMQPKALELASPTNRRRSCQRLPRMSLLPWLILT